MGQTPGAALPRALGRRHRLGGNHKLFAIHPKVKRLAFLRLHRSRSNRPHDGRQVGFTRPRSHRRTRREQSAHNRRGRSDPGSRFRMLVPKPGSEARGSGGLEDLSCGAVLSADAEGICDRSLERSLSMPSNQKDSQSELTLKTHAEFKSRLLA